MLNTFKFINQKNGKETLVNGSKCSLIGSYFKVYIVGRAEPVGSFYKETHEMQVLPYDPNADTVEYFDFGPMEFYFED